MINKAILKDKEVIVKDDLLEWAKWFEDADRTLARDKVGNMVISTVFLGIDHGFGGEPKWFETMIFEGPRLRDKFQERYSTYDEAMAGHHKAVDMVRFKIMFN